MFNKLAVHSISYQTSRTYTMACNRERFSTRSGQRFESRLFIYHIKPICLFVFAVVFCKFLYIKYSLYYRGRASVQCHSRHPPIVDGPAASLVYETVELMCSTVVTTWHILIGKVSNNIMTLWWCWRDINLSLLTINDVDAKSLVVRESHILVIGLVCSMHNGVRSNGML